MSIETSKTGSVSFTGAAAVDVFRLHTLRSALKLYLATGMKPTRGVGLKQMLQLATEFTGKTYANSKAQGAQALVDLAAVAAPMTSAPHSH